MAKGMLRFLSREEMERIHAASLRVLGEVGVVIHSSRVKKTVVDAGATVSRDATRVLIPESLVKSSIAQAPKTVVLAARGGRPHIRIPSDRLYVTNGGEGIYVKDLVTGDKRPTTTDDYRDFMVLVEALPQIDFAWGMVGALEQPSHLKDVVETATAFKYTSKHIQGGAATAEDAIRAIRIASVFTGGVHELAKKPVLSSVCCPISPLIFEDGLSEAQVEFARVGVPVVAMSAAVAGLTSPVTLAGTLTQVNAENLASLVITQTAKKGAPWIYSSDSSPGDLKTGSIDYGAIEGHLLRTGAAEMGKYYGFPTMTAGIGLEESSALLGTVRDGVPYMIVMGLVPSDLGSGFGGLDQAAGASFEQFIIDAWVWDLAREFIRTFDTDEGAIALDVIREAALDGNFLGKRHTITRFKKEAIATVKPDAVFSGRNNSAEKGAVVKRAKKEVEKILKDARKVVVSKDEARMIDQVVESVRRG